MRRVLWGIEAVLLLIFALLLTNYFSNEWMIRQYEQKNYQTNYLSFLGFWEPYVPAYNLGNVYYQKGEYENAVNKYKEALKYHPPQKYDCKIRINEVLALLATFHEDKVTVENYDESIEYLQNAKAILCENGCATEEGDNWHSVNAQQLKEDIDDCIYRLGVKVDFIKNDERGVMLAGATLQILDENEEVMYEWVSDGLPYTQIRFLIGHSYIYRELKAPEGYQKSEDIIFTVKEDGTIEYEQADKDSDRKGNEVVMIDRKEDSNDSSSGGQQQQDPNQGSADQDDSSDEQDDQDDKLKRELDELQKEGQEQRNAEITDGNANYEYYDGATW